MRLHRDLCTLKTLNRTIALALLHPRDSMEKIHMALQKTSVRPEYDVLAGTYQNRVIHRLVVRSIDQCMNARYRVIVLLVHV